MQETLKLSIATLEWAANKAGSSLDDFASALYAKRDVVERIVRGQLTIAQIRKFSERAKVPFGFLFLPSPPAEYQPDSNLVDFRTTRNSQPLSNDFLDVYKDIEHKQSWYRDYLIRIDAPKLEFVAKYRAIKDTPEKRIAEDIRTTLGIENIADSLKSAEDYYSAIVRSCEDAGILVFKNSVVVNSTKRKLSSEEFRGFVISDEYAPAIFINGEDTKYANIFTLAHELAHVWLGESGISDVDIDSRNREEMKCNAIAAEVLVPSEIFMARWDDAQGGSRDKIARLNKLFKVSELVVARVALRYGKITPKVYRDLYAEVMRRVQEKKRRDKDKPTAIPPEVTLPIRNSRRLTKTVVDLVKGNRLAPSEAAILLNTSAVKVASL